MESHDGMHFGALVRRLRQNRNLTQGQLANFAGVAINTIQRAELMPECTLKRSTLTVMLSALQNLAPLTRDEERDFARLSGLEGILAAARNLMPPPFNAVPAAYDGHDHRSGQPCESFGYDGGGR